jgi:hypothetical protein
MCLYTYTPLPSKVAYFTNSGERAYINVIWSHILNTMPMMFSSFSPNRAKCLLTTTSGAKSSAISCLRHYLHVGVCNYIISWEGIGSMIEPCILNLYQHFICRRFQTLATWKSIPVLYLCAYIGPGKHRRIEIHPWTYLCVHTTLLRTFVLVTCKPRQIQTDRSKHTNVV